VLLPAFYIEVGGRISKTLVPISTRIHVKSEITLIHLVTAVEHLKSVISFTVEISVLSDVCEEINKDL
jgi:hypothetical protein